VLFVCSAVPARALRFDRPAVEDALPVACDIWLSAGRIGSLWHVSLAQQPPQSRHALDFLTSIDLPPDPQQLEHEPQPDAQQPVEAQQGDPPQQLWNE
jgi:hypothetical protein